MIKVAILSTIVAWGSQVGAAEWGESAIYDPPPMNLRLEVFKVPAMEADLYVDEDPAMEKGQDTVGIIRARDTPMGALYRWMSRDPTPSILNIVKLSASFDVPKGEEFEMTVKTFGEYVIEFGSDKKEFFTGGPDSNDDCMLVSRTFTHHDLPSYQQERTLDFFLQITEKNSCPPYMEIEGPILHQDYYPVVHRFDARGEKSSSERDIHAASRTLRDAPFKHEEHDKHSKEEEKYPDDEYDEYDGTKPSDEMEYEDDKEDDPRRPSDDEEYNGEDNRRSPDYEKDEGEYEKDEEEYEKDEKDSDDKWRSPEGTEDPDDEAKRFNGDEPKEPEDYEKEDEGDMKRDSTPRGDEKDEEPNKEGSPEGEQMNDDKYDDKYDDEYDDEYDDKYDDEYTDEYDDDYDDEYDKEEYKDDDKDEYKGDDEDPARFNGEEKDEEKEDKSAIPGRDSEPNSNGSSSKSRESEDAKEIVEESPFVIEQEDRFQLFRTDSPTDAPTEMPSNAEAVYYPNGPAERIRDPPRYVDIDDDDDATDLSNEDTEDDGRVSLISTYGMAGIGLGVGAVLIAILVVRRSYRKRNPMEQKKGSSI